MPELWQGMGLPSVFSGYDGGTAAVRPGTFSSYQNYTGWQGNPVLGSKPILSS